MAQPFRLKALIPPERDVKHAVLAYLRVCPACHRAWLVNSGAVASEYTDRLGTRRKRYVRFNGVPGHSDIAGILKGGRALFIEVKRPGEKPEPPQQSFLDDMTAAGALAFWVSSVDEVARIIYG